jgi:5-methylcytosine-specific restriction endonuclease McrA
MNRRPRNNWSLATSFEPTSYSPMLRTVAPPSRRSTTKWHHLYASHAWRKASEAFRASPDGALCVACKARGIVRASELVDHIRPHNGDLRLFWDRSNWAAMCWSCHSAKSRADEHQARTGRPALRRGADERGFPIDPNHPWHREARR